MIDKLNEYDITIKITLKAANDKEAKTIAKNIAGNHNHSDWNHLNEHVEADVVTIERVYGSMSKETIYQNNNLKNE